MKKGEKKFVFVLAIIAAIAIIAIFIAKGNMQKSGDNQQVQAGEFTQVLADGTKLNTSAKLNSEKMFNDNVKISNIQLTEKNNQTQLLADVTNISETDLGSETLIKVVLLDKEGKTIDTINGIIAPLKAGETSQLNVNVTSDQSDAYDFRVEAQ